MGMMAVGGQRTDGDAGRSAPFVPLLWRIPGIESSGLAKAHPVSDHWRFRWAACAGVARWPGVSLSREDRAAVRPACALAAPPGGWTAAQSNRLSSLLVVPEGWSVQYRPEPVGVKETPEIPLATTVTVPVATMGMTGAAWAMISCSGL